MYGRLTIQRVIGEHIQKSRAFVRSVTTKSNLSPLQCSPGIRGDAKYFEYSIGHLQIPAYITIWSADEQHRANVIQYAINELSINLRDFGFQLPSYPPKMLMQKQVICDN